MPPPDQLPPTGLPDNARSLTPLIDSLAPLERRVTIYARGLIWSREQATWVRVYRAPYAQYADAFHIEFKPRRKRLIRQFVDYKPSAIIVAGWDHPETLPRIFLPSYEKSTLAPSASSVTIGGPAATDMDRIVDRYVRSLPAANIILDLRGQVVDANRKWS